MMGDFIERLNNLDFNKGTKFKFLDKIYLYDYPNLTGIYEIGKPTKREYSIFTQLDITNLHKEVEIIEDEQEINIQDIHKLTLMKEIHDYDYRDIEINRLKINKLVQAVKQLDRKINKK